MVSGRPIASLRKVLAELTWLKTFIPSNGAAIIDVAGDSVEVVGSMPRSVATGLYEFAHHDQLGVCWYEPRSWYVTRVDDLILLEIQRSETEPRLVANLSEIKGPIIKALIIGSPPLVSQLSESLQGLRDTPGSFARQIHWFGTYPEYLEVMPLGVSKRIACERVMERLGVSRDEALAVGDGVNDLPMFEAVGTRVAVANSEPFVQRHADLIAPSNDDDGVATVLSALVLNNADAERSLRPSGESPEIP